MRSNTQTRSAVRRLALARLISITGGAAAFAALLSGAYAPGADERVGVVVCGGNTTAVDFGRA